MRGWRAVAVWTTACAGLSACPAEVICPDGQEGQPDGTCAPVESDVPDASDLPEDTDEPVVQQSQVTLSWTITAVPNDTVVRLRCDDRQLLQEDIFTFENTYNQVFSIPPGEMCQVEISDARGGLLPGGSLEVCSQEVLTWEATRGLVTDLPEVETFLCVPGCTDPVAENYEDGTNLDDGSCEYLYGCTDEEALNYDPIATKNDGTCDHGGVSLVELAVFTNNRPLDNQVWITCKGAEALRIAPVLSKSYESRKVAVQAGADCIVHVSDKNGDEGPAGAVRMCGEVVVDWDRTEGHTGRAYEVEVGSFSTKACSGCTDPLAPNYDETALVEDGSCEL